MELLLLAVAFFALYFVFLAIAAWLFLPVWAVHHLGIDMIDLAKAKANGDAGHLIGRKAREQIGLALWGLSRRLAVLEREKIETRISFRIERVMPGNMTIMIKDKSNAEDVEGIARCVLSSGMEALAITVKVEVTAVAHSERSAEALKNAGSSLQALRFMVLANIPFQKFSMINIEARGWIAAY